MFSSSGVPAATEGGCDGYVCPVPEVGPAVTERGCYGDILSILYLVVALTSDCLGFSSPGN